MGLVAISSSFIATLAAVVILGVLLMMGGAVEIVDAFFGRGWRGFRMDLLAGILYLVLEFLLVQRPLRSSIGPTFLLIQE